MTDQQDPGWDLAEFTCGQCWTTVRATTQGGLNRVMAEHRAACPRTATDDAE